MALGNYQDLDGYLATQHRNTGHPTVLPGALDSAREGYGVYVGDEISGQAALDRAARDVANSRAALDSTMNLVTNYRNFQDQEAMRASNMEDLQMAHEQRERDSEAAKLRFQAEEPELYAAIEEGQLRAKARKNEVRRIEAASKVPMFTILSELYDDGQVSQQTIAEYNESVANNPEKAQLSSFVKDPETGELYGISTKGEYIPFTSTGLLDAWAAYHPGAKDWALSAYPEKVRAAKKEEWNLQEERAKFMQDAQKTEQDRINKAAKDELDMLKTFINQADDDIKNIRDMINDGAYSSEEERIALNDQLKHAQAQRKVYVQKAQSLYDPSLILQTPTGGATAEAAARFKAAQQSAQGVSFGGGGGTKSWRDIGKEKPQQ